MDGSLYGLVWLIIGLPVAGFLIQALIGKRIIGDGSGKRIAGAFAVAPIVLAFGIAVFLTTKLLELESGAREMVVPGFDWIKIAGLNIPFEARVDPLTMLMTLIITGIGALIHLYATGYMSEEKDYARFFTYLNLFIAAMLILVLGNNLVLMFIGWEGVGLCSYLLIGFWYKDIANAKAANKAFIVNRIGDWGLTLGMFLLLVVIAANAQNLSTIDDQRYLSYDVLLQNLPAILGSKILIWSVPGGKKIGEVLGKGANLYSGSFNPLTDAFVSATLTNSTRLYRQTGTGPKVLSFFGSDPQGQLDVCWNKQGTMVLTGEKSGNAVLFDVKAQKKFGTLKGHMDFVTSVGFAPNGKVAATASPDRTVRLWDTKTLASLAVLENQSGIGSPLAFTADGKFLVTTGIDDFMQVYALTPALTTTPVPVGKTKKG